jgi:hypothetical protein
MAKGRRMIRSLCRGEHAIADQASPHATDGDKDFANHLDLLLFIGHD